MKLARIVLVLAALAAPLGCNQQHAKVGAVAVAPPTFRVIPSGMNPNTAGIPGATGDILQNAGGRGAWALDANGVWQPFPVSGGISTVTVVDGGGILGNGSPDAGLSAAAQFGPHVQVLQPNASSIQKDTLDINTTYTVNTNGSEESQTVMGVLHGGAVTSFMTANATTVQVPAGVYTGIPSTTFPGISLGDGKTGIEKFGSAGLAVEVSDGNVPVTFDMAGPSTSGQVNISSSFATLTLGGDTHVDRSVDHTAAVSVMELVPTFGGTNTAVEVGPPGALATTAVGATLGITTTPGKPSFTPYYTTGHSPMVYDTTDNELCMWNPTGTPGWKCSAAFPN